jgi:hypothetical protein
MLGLGLLFQHNQGVIGVASHYSFGRLEIGLDNPNVSSRPIE